MILMCLELPNHKSVVTLSSSKNVTNFDSKNIVEEASLANFVELKEVQLMTVYRNRRKSCPSCF